MSILIFVLVLIALIVVHEFGHFVAAKLSGMRVDEFGLGYPPKAWGKKIGETEYTLNWLPFGGFVKIFGEDPEPGQLAAPRSFTSKPRILQALVLVAGIAMNLLFAYVLITATLFMGTTRALTDEEARMAPDAQLAVASVLPGSPAADAGLLPGDIILSAVSDARTFEGASATTFTAFVAEDASVGENLTISVLGLDGTEREVAVRPEAGIIASDPERPALGVGLAVIGTLSMPWWQAPLDGALITWELTKQTAIALVGFFGSIFTFSADLAQVSGPVGIAGAVGSASEDGIASLLTITALISINLALINLLPIPALDGGRLLFVIIEAIIRRPIPTAFANAVNGIGFIALILLMLVVTASDIFKIVG
ncbi:MAG TPA: M50 family metallopeptidase [Candidatus Paceibacterota bacterium]|nr:M50 family metallopeptidase [Candidatus Paceibacterota bacterium]